MLPIHTFMQMELLAAPVPVSEVGLLCRDSHPRSGTKPTSDRGQGGGMWAGPTKLSEFSPLSGWAKALTHTARQLWAPLTPKWAFKAVHPPPLRSGLQRSRPTAPESGKFKPSTPPANVLPFYIQRVPYRNIICSNFRFHKRQSEM